MISPFQAGKRGRQTDWIMVWVSKGVVRKFGLIKGGVWGLDLDGTAWKRINGEIGKRRQVVTTYERLER